MKNKKVSVFNFLAIAVIGIFILTGVAGWYDPALKMEKETRLFVTAGAALLLGVLSFFRLKYEEGYAEELKKNAKPTLLIIGAGLLIGVVLFSYFFFKPRF